MCGRYQSTSSPEAIAEYFDAEVAAPELDRSFNVAPSNDVYGVVATPQGRRLEAFHWGFVPSWAKDIKMGMKMINARAETVATSGAFKTSFAKRRCIVPADGFYEWQAVAGPPDQPKKKAKKQPMYICRRDGKPIAFAGLWAVWKDPKGGPEATWLHSLTIITTDANATMVPVHDRMPVILPESTWEEWLDPTNHDTERLARLLVPAPDDLLELRPISTAVNDVRNNGPELIEPLSGEGSADSPTLFS
jgi:putative SOS response-associated peptidase YedK